MTEQQRYWEYIQRQIMPEGWESQFSEKNAVRLMRDSERWKEDPAYRRSDKAKQDFLRFLDEYRPQTQFDSAVSHKIFQPIVDQLVEVAKRGPVKNLGQIRLLSSTDPSPSPLARSSASEHLLLIGQGTASYCNYWAKVFAPIVVRLFCQDASFRIRSDAEVEAAAHGVPHCIKLASVVGLHFALFGTTLNIGRVISQPEHLAYRVELLTAMERFIIAHEISHFVAYEKISGADGMMDPEDEKTIELFCDDLGLALSRAVAAEQGCLLGRSGVAAILFFRTIAWGSELRKAMGNEDVGRERHPGCEERIQLIRSRVLQFDEDKEGLLSMLSFYDAMCASVIALANRRLSGFVEEFSCMQKPNAGR